MQQRRWRASVDAPNRETWGRELQGVAAEMNSAVLDADHPDEGSFPQRLSNVRPRRSSTGKPGWGG